MSGTFGEVEHFVSMVAGIESMNSGQPLDPDGKYAYSVLKLHAVDFGAVVGQEGFLDNVKAAAGKAGEWIKKLVAAIKNWLTGSKKTTGDEEKANNAAKAKVAEAVRKAEPAKKEKMHAAAEATHKNVLPQIQKLIDKLNGIKGSLSGDGWNELGFAPNFDDVIKHLKEADKGYSESNPFEIGTALTRGCWSLEGEIDKLNTALSKVGGDDAERLKVGKVAGKKIETLGAIVVGMNKMSERLRHKLLDDFMLSDKPLAI